MGREERIQCREEQKCPEDEEKEESKFKIRCQSRKYGREGERQKRPQGPGSNISDQL